MAYKKLSRHFIKRGKRFLEFGWGVDEYETAKSEIYAAKNSLTAQDNLESGEEFEKDIKKPKKIQI